MRDNTSQHSHGPWSGHWHRGGHGLHHDGGQQGSHERGRGPGGRHGRNWQDFFAEGGAPWAGSGFGWGGRPGPGGGHGGGRERLERGLLRYIILDALKDGPKHGYEIIKTMEEKTQGRYSPSPGTLYPTLQYLEDLGWVRSDQEADRRVYNLTDSGRTELTARSEMVDGFWSRFGDRTPWGANMHEIKFAADALKDLMRTTGEGLRSAAFARDTETALKIRQALERSENEIRTILAQSATPSPAPEGKPENESGQETRDFRQGDSNSNL
ncbi:MAG: PadR family transcriptional regulator [Chloroflexota bacterium]